MQTYSGWAGGWSGARYDSISLEFNSTIANQHPPTQSMRHASKFPQSDRLKRDISVGSWVLTGALVCHHYRWMCMNPIVMEFVGLFHFGEQQQFSAQNFTLHRFSSFDWFRTQPPEQMMMMLMIVCDTSLLLICVFIADHWALVRSGKVL